MPPSPGEDTVRERLRRLPAVLRQTLDTALPALPPDAAARGITTTGVGSSEAAARLLTHLLQSAGIRSAFLPFASFYSGDLPLPASPPYLAVFSQGLAPNACMVLHRRAAFAGTLLFTAATPAGQKQAGRTERAALLETLLREGACILTHPEENEYLILPRFLGPVCALLTACRVAETLAPGCCGGPAALAQIPDRFHPIPCTAADAAEAAAELRHHPVFLFSNSVGLYAQNLAAKCMETLLTPPPWWRTVLLTPMDSSRCTAPCPPPNGSSAAPMPTRPTCLPASNPFSAAAAPCGFSAAPSPRPWRSSISKPGSTPFSSPFWSRK